MKLQNCSVDYNTSLTVCKVEVAEEVNTLLQSIWTVTGLFPVILDRKVNLMWLRPNFTTWCILEHAQ